MDGIKWDELGMGVAALIAMIYIVRTMKGIMSEVMKFLYNHMSTITVALTHVADRLETMGDKFDHLADTLEDANDAKNREDP